MQLLILTVWLLTTILICDAVQLTNNGNDFCIGFMRSAFNEPVRILIGTQSNLSIVFHLEYPLGSVIRTTTKNAPYQVNLFGEDVVNAVTAETSEYDDRNKGICITSTNGTDVLFVLAYITLSDRASASYLALPYQEILTNEYEYYALSSSSSSDIYYSGLLLVGFRDNTTVVIYPSIALNIPHDIQDRNSISKLIHPGENHRITLHRGQTLFIGKDQGDDVTGTRIVSDKPLTVISGHQAGSVPSSGTAEPMAQQILPTQLWGKRFLIIPFAGHDKGQYIKVLTSKDNTQVTYNCVYYNSVHIQNAGNVHQFFVSSDTYCYLEANNSVLVGQFAASPKGNTDGDTTMVLVASLDQYSNSFFFSTLNSSGLTHYISISVSSDYMYFDPDSILYDDISIETEWTAIYDDENGIIGYGCTFEVLQGLHTVAHLDCIGCLFVMVYGSTTGRAYSYPAGLTLSSKNVLDFSFSSDSYTITEAENNLSFEVKSLGTHNVDVVFKYSTKMMSYTTNGLDYDFVTDQVIIVSANDDSFTINVTIHDDELSEADEQFGIEVCTDFETNNICFMTVVTIIDNDVLGISLTQLNYDTGSLTISVSKMEGELAPEYSFSAFLETVLNSAIGNITDTTISNELIFDRFHATYHFEYKLPNEESLYKIVVHLSSLNETIPVSIQTSILSATLQGEFSQDSNLQIIESTSTTDTTDSTRSTALGTGTTIGAVTTIGTGITIGTSSTGFTSSSLISTSNINSTSTIGANSDACSTILVIQPEQTNTTSLATDPFSLPLKNSQVNHENILVYVGVASVVLVISLLACIMTLTASILLYRRGRRKSEQETRNLRPTIVHPTLAITNSSDTENAPKTNAMVLVRPRASRSAIRSRSLAIQEEHSPRTMLDENPCEQVSLQRHHINPLLDDELINKEILSSHAFHPQDVELTASELDFAKTLGNIENSSMNAESQL